MVRNLEASPGDLRGGAAEGVSPPPETFGAGNDGKKREDGLGKEGRLDPGISLASANGARYKSMSPARLPISRTPCLTIPPGFSPSALLESPVLTNMKAAPSPTTGTFNMSSIMHRADALSSPRDASTVNTDNEGSSSDFEFKRHVTGSYNLGLSPLRPLGSIDFIQEDLKPSMHLQCQSQDQNKVTSKDDVILLVSAPGLVTESDESHQNTQMCQSDYCSESTNSSALENSAEDGYNWRKYGQKHVKGSEYPRSYYKCTHPNCEMKKQIERSHQGQITGIIYKGHHDHPKPQPNRHLAVGSILTNQEEEKTDNFPSSMIVEDESAVAPGQISNQVEPNDNTELSPTMISENDVESGGGKSNKCDEVAGDGDLEAKRRKMEITMNDAASIGKINREPRVVVQTVSEVDILDDGYRWRKYGQKVVKGNPNPRSYYKCTTAGCPVRKHVERASHDPKAVITTYEGKHNHDVPVAKTSGHEAPSSMVADGDSSLTTHSSAALGGIMRPFPHPFARTESQTVSLDLGVGISPSQSNFTYEKQRSRETNQIQHHHFQPMDCGKLVIQATPLSNFYGSSHARIYEHGESRSEGLTSKAVYYTTTGNLVMGP